MLASQTVHRVRFYMHEQELTDPVIPDKNVKLYKGHGFTHQGQIYDYTVIEIDFGVNYAIGCCAYTLCPESTCCGYHQGDVEAIYLLHPPGSNEVDHVYYKAHGHGQGQWRPLHACEYNYFQQTLMVYVALSSHAMYPHAGIQWRLFGLANDYTSLNGTSFDVSLTDSPYTAVVEPPHRIAETSSTAAERFWCLCCIK